MNIKKPVDYSKMYAALDRILSSGIAQMDRFREIGRLIDDRPEKGAAVAAADYISAMYPNVRGFSPRGVRRMREFYRAYKNNPALMSQAMKISWTANVVIIECCKTDYEREWYIQAVRKFGWSKQVLTAKIAENEHKHMNLDIYEDKCYTKNVQVTLEHTTENTSNSNTILPEPQPSHYCAAEATSDSLPRFMPKYYRQHVPTKGTRLPYSQFNLRIIDSRFQDFLARHCGGLPRSACEV